MVAIKQGDSYYLPVSVTLDGNALELEAIACAEFYLEGRRKLYPGEVSYDAMTQTFQIQLSQEETFAWVANKAVTLDIRLKFTNGDVIGLPKPLSINVSRALSREVL